MAPSDSDNPWDPAVREAALQDRVRDVYAVLQRYRLHGHIEPDCFAPDDRSLLAAPLPELPAEAFQTYQWKAMTAWGTEDHFKHFLPRMLELVVAPDPDPDETYPLDRDIVFSKVRYGAWRTWPKQEQRALEELFDALWGALLTRPARFRLSEWLRALAQCLDDLTPYLQRWEFEAGDPAHGLTPAAQLADLAVDVSEGRDAGLASPAQLAQVTQWLASEHVLQLLEAAYFRWSATGHGAILSAAHERLAVWRQRQFQARPVGHVVNVDPQSVARSNSTRAACCRTSSVTNTMPPSSVLLTTILSDSRPSSTSV